MRTKVQHLEHSSKHGIAVLAYSGGLDTSVAIRWIREKYSVDVVTVSIDVGQKEDLKEGAERAISNGAIDSIIIDSKDEFADDYIVPAIKANALYEGKYPLSTALARPLIAAKIVKVAKKYGAKYVAHGCTGKGNDQVRFEFTFAAIDPSLKVIAPIREWNMNREDEVEYAAKHGISLRKSQPSRFSTDENLWGRSIEGGELEDPSQEPPEEIYEWTSHQDLWPDVAARISIGFARGVPVTLNGSRMKLAQLIKEVNTVAGMHGVGRIDHVEDRFVGIKSRENYECPAATVLLQGHRALESLVLSRDINLFKPVVEARFSELVYNGMWFTGLRTAIEAFLNDTQEHVTGEVKMAMYKGRATVTGVASDYSKYEPKLSTYGRGDVFSQKAAEGFIYIAGLPMRGTAAGRLEKTDDAEGTLERKVQR